MKCPSLLALAAVLCLAASLACAQTEERAMLPEVQALWTPYQAALKAVDYDRDQKLKNLDYVYMLNLDKLQKDRSAAGDLDGAVAAKAELGRLGARQETTAEQIKAMNPALQKLRVAYDTALKNYDAEAAKSSAALLQKLLADLEEVQRRITTTGDLQKALEVKAEKGRIAAEAAQARPAMETGAKATAAAEVPKERPPLDPPGKAPSSNSSRPKLPIGVPPDAQLFNGKWYRVYVENCGWTEARDKCARLFGRLAMVPDRETQRFIHKLANHRNVWLGALKTRDKGWTWVDGKPMTFTAWAKGEPNGTKDEDFLHMWDSGEWNDAGNHYGKVHGFICEWLAK